MKIFELIQQEEKRQSETLSLIASENHVSKKVKKALASGLTNKYAEGYPNKRYYAGNAVIDKIEQLTIDQAKELFGAEHVNVQPYSGTPANLAVYSALANVGDTIMGMSLEHGGHLSHGHKVSFTSRAFKFVQYGVDEDTKLLDYEEIGKLARVFKPKIIVCGATAYSRKFDFKKFSEIAKDVGAYLVADISHIAGLVVAGEHESPILYADVVVTTTHKTLRGPRGAIILCKKELANKIDKAVFPGLQGGPHINNIAAMSVCFEETSKLEFKNYIKQVVVNAKTLAEALINEGLEIVTSGTDNHIILVDLTNQKVSGAEIENTLEKVGLVTNKNMIPGDSQKPLDPSGLRLGTPAITTRGMKEKEMKILAKLISQIVKNPQDKLILKQVATDVAELVKNFPIPE